MRDKSKNPLLFLLLFYALAAVFLDSTFPIPKHDWVAGVMKIGHWSTIGIAMFLLCYNSIPEVFEEIDPYVKIHKHKLIYTSVFIAALMLAISIRAGGDIRSPYVSFLSSFPIFFMVLLFDDVTLKTCAKGAAIAVGSLIIVYAIDYLIWFMMDSSMSVSLQSLTEFLRADSSISVKEQSLTSFLRSESAMWLAFFILSITSIANILSIYVGAREDENLNREIGGMEGAV
jgi:hypothetical protein